MNSCIMCFSSMNKLTRTVLLLLTFLLATMQSTTTTTIANNIATIKQTDTTIQPASTSTTSTTTHSNHNNNKNDFLAQPTFNVKLRGTLPLHRDNFLASLLSSKISNHNRNNYSNSNHHNINSARNRNHGMSASTSTGARLANSGSGYYQNSNGNNKSQMNHNSRIQQYYNSISPLDYNSIVDHSLDHVTITTTTTRSLSTVTYLPVFDFGVPRNITARAGQTASITCRVDNLGDKSVSWIRKRDLHILTAGILTYTSDERFKVVRTTDSKNWSLHVKYAQPRDSGIYECQVNTEPKISMAFRLNVIVTPPDAKAVIIGPTDLYAKVGSAITLTCHVKQPSSAHDIGPIYWYRGPYVLTPFVAHPNDAAIDLQRISMESKLVEQLQSRLRIANAQTIDSGNYTCMPTTAEAASVMVNVINDESPAAMQKSSVGTNKNTVYHNCLLILLFYAFQHMLNVQRIAL